MKLTKFQRARLYGKPSQRGWVQVGLMVLSIGLSIIAGRMLAKKSSPLDDIPTTLSRRGSFMNWFLGRRELGPVFAWAGLRERRKEEADGGKGFGGGSEVDVVYEAGWHLIGVGATQGQDEMCLLGIKQAGKLILSGPITPVSHPSGTFIDLGKEGAFYIYWGEVDQPLAPAVLRDNIGVDSRWPFHCYIVWSKKRLGGSPNWPNLTYIMERRSTFNLLQRSASWYGSLFAVIPGVADVSPLSVLANANQDLGYIEILSKDDFTFKPKTDIQISGMGTAFDGIHRLLRSERVETILAPGGMFVPPVIQTTTKLFFIGGTADAVLVGGVLLSALKSDGSAGGNIAHMAAEVLFAPFPRGMGMDPGGIEPWNVESFEEFGEEAEADEWRSSIVATEGETVEAVFGNVLQDHGIMCIIDNFGELKLQRVREPVGILATLGEDLYSGNLPERENLLGEMPVDRLIFSFTDRENQYGEMTITVDEDGQATRESIHRARNVGISSTVQFKTAAQLAELRSPEELAQGAEIRLDVSRDARRLLPGEAIIVAGIDEILRITEVDIDPLSERVKLKAVPDFYGARKSDFISDRGVLADEPLAPAPDPIFAWAEIPQQLQGTFPQNNQIVVLDIRANSQVDVSGNHLSADGMTYTLESSDREVVTGGTLVTGFPAKTLNLLVNGPDYIELGPDNAALTSDLSADPVNYGLGRQLCVIISSAGTEICFLERATIVSAGVRRLDGLLRARYGTQQLSHPAGASVFIFTIGSVTLLEDALLQADSILYLKTQPSGSGGQVLLSQVSPYIGFLYGKGQRPAVPRSLHLTLPSPASASREVGADVRLSWLLTTGSIATGMGAQELGAAVAPAAIPGTVLVELLNSTDVVVASKSVAAGVTSMDWSTVELAAATALFKFRATHTANGLASLASDPLTVNTI